MVKGILWGCCGKDTGVAVFLWVFMVCPTTRRVAILSVPLQVVFFVAFGPVRRDGYSLKSSGVCIRVAPAQVKRIERLLHGAACAQIPDISVRFASFVPPISPRIQIHTIGPTCAGHVPTPGRLLPAPTLPCPRRTALRLPWPTARWCSYPH